ncbi:MAG: hypothetical protein K2G45_12345 [Lachnospiraceae bacterium]|nr:hypothetical protein [Lachnospiraceae bacterium]
MMIKRNQVLYLLLTMILLCGCSNQENIETSTAVVDKTSTEIENTTVIEPSVPTEMENIEYEEKYARFLSEDDVWEEMRDIDKKDIATIAEGNIVSQGETVSLGGFGYKVNEVEYFENPYDVPNHTDAEADDLLAADIGFKYFFYVTFTVTNDSAEESEFFRNYEGVIGFGDRRCPFPGENDYVKDMEGNNQQTIILQPGESKDVCVLLAVPDYVSLEWDKPENLDNPDFYFSIHKSYGSAYIGKSISQDTTSMYIKCNVKNWK